METIQIQIQKLQIKEVDTEITFVVYIVFIILIRSAGIDQEEIVEPVVISNTPVKRVGT